MLLAGVPIYFFVTGGTLQSVLYDAYGLSAATAIIVGTRMHRPSVRGPWLAFAGGLLLFSIGDVLFNIWTIAGVPIAFPSVADYLYLAAYPVLAVGFLVIVRRRARTAVVESALDGVMIAVGVGVVAWVFLLAHYAHDSSLSIVSRLTSIAYPGFDLLLIAVVCHLAFSGGVRNLSYRLLFASVISLIVADSFYAFATLHGSYVNGSPIDLGWLLSYALWGAAALHPSMLRLTEPSRPSAVPRTRVRLALLGIAALTAPTFLIVRGLQGDKSDEALLAALSALMFVLVLVRLSLTTRDLNAVNDHLTGLNARQTVFLKTAEAFVGAIDIDSVAQAGVHAAVALAEDDGSWSSFIANGPSGPTVVAVDGHAPVRVGESAKSLVSGSSGERAYEVPTDPSANGTCAENGDPFRTLYVKSVMVEGENRGDLVVCCARGADTEFQASLAMLCSEMALALKSVEATEQRLRTQSERRLRSLVQESSDLVTLIGPEGFVHYQSPSALAVLGRDAVDVVGTQLSQLLHPDDEASVRDHLAKILAGGLRSTVQFECRLGHANGTWRVMDCVMTNLLDDPDIDAILLNGRDMTDRRALEQELLKQAFHDPLTGLPNRALFVDRLHHALNRAEREGAAIAALFLDIDDFKTINDSIGHEAGDKVLVAVAERLNAAIRPGDTVARFGGDEFAFLLDSGEMPLAAEQVAARVAVVLKEPILIGSERISIQASIGISLSQPHVDGPDSLLRDADLAMYMAKRSGKGRFKFFEPAMLEAVVHRFDLSTELRLAIDNGEFEVYYQPLVNAHTSTPVGVEALIRWCHPRRGMISPLEFIDVAESTGLIVRIGTWVLNQACLQAQIWRTDGVVDNSFYVSVNLSARQLAESTLVDDVSEALRASGLPASALVLEITETSLMLDFDSGLARLNELKDLGLKIALDDYGTGYSSLNRLSRLPVDIVKIDKSFIDRLTVNRAGQALVQSVIDVTSALGKHSIAEGVEDQDKATALDEMGCDTIQGFLYAKPMPAADAARSLQYLKSIRLAMAGDSTPK